MPWQHSFPHTDTCSGQGLRRREEAPSCFCLRCRFPSWTSPPLFLPSREQSGFWDPLQQRLRCHTHTITFNRLGQHTKRHCNNICNVQCVWPLCNCYWLQIMNNDRRDATPHLICLMFFTSLGGGGGGGIYCTLAKTLHIIIFIRSLTLHLQNLIFSTKGPVDTLSRIVLTVI